MNSSEKAMDLLTLPKTIYNSIDRVAYILFGKLMKESGELLAEKVKYQRFKNQVRIFEKAKKYARESGLDSNQINIKLLVPLLEYTSLECNETVQDRWARIINNICYGDTDQSFDLKCIELMREISDNEIFIIDWAYTQLMDAKEKHNKYDFDEKKQGLIILSDEEKKELDRENPFTIELFTFALQMFPIKLNITSHKAELYMERLLSHHIFRSSLPYLTDKETESHLYQDLKRSGTYEFTNFGLYFVELCKFRNLKT